MLNRSREGCANLSWIQTAACAGDIRWCREILCLRSFGAPITLSLPNTPQDSGGPRIAVDKNGNIFVAWTDRIAQDQNKPGNFCTNQVGTRDASGVRWEAWGRKQNELPISLRFRWLDLRPPC